MPRCKHIYRVGFTKSLGPHAELRCVLQSHESKGLCVIEEPVTMLRFEVSPQRSHRVIAPMNFSHRPWPVPLPSPGPFGPEIRLPDRYATWTEVEEEILVRRRSVQLIKPEDQKPCVRKNNFC